MAIPNAGRISSLRQEINEARSNIRAILQGKLALLRQFPAARFNHSQITPPGDLGLGDANADLRVLQSAATQIDRAVAQILHLPREHPTLQSDPYLQWFIAENAKLDEALKGWCAHYNARVEEYNKLRTHFLGSLFSRFGDMPEIPYWLDQAAVADVWTPSVQTPDLATARHTPPDHKTDDSSLSSLGAADSISSWTPHSTPSRKNDVHAWLEVIRGSTGSPLVTVYDGLVIGRGRGVEVQLSDISVSRRHAIIRVRDGVCYLQDQHSVNGTYVNRRRIMATALKDGDRIQIGDAEIVFHSK